VADTGIGIKKEDLSSLFTPFERIEENKNRTIEGTGLGMSIVKNLLDMMDSSLQVESTYGEGSTFSFSVVQEVVSWEPMGDFAEMYERSLESTKEYHTAFQAPDAKILVVDDTKMNLTVIRGLLTPTRIDITTALSGQEAIDKVSNTHFDMIFLDQRMPGLDGIETLQYMKKNLPERIEGVPIIALTANAISGARDRFIKAGFDDYLTKPIDSVKLENTIAALLPKNLVIHPEDEGYEDTSEDASATTDKAPQDEMLKKYSQFDEISYNDAIANCLKEEILSEAINDFYAASKTGPDEIEKYLTEKDLKNYTVKVHALKSSARIIGATAFGEEAQQLENAGKSGDTAYILQHHEAFITKCRSYKEPLAALFAKAAEDDKPLVDIDLLKGAYEEIREAAEEMDCSRLEEIFVELAEYGIPDSEAAKWESLKAAAEQFDYDKIIAILAE
jgi:CheY-like chemotaxis protein